MKNTGGWLALAALIVVPFAVDNFEVPRLVVLAIGAVVLAYVTELKAPRALLIVLGLVLGAAVITTITSRAPAFSAPGLISLVVLAAFALAADQHSWRPVLWTTWPIAAWAIAQGLGLDPVDWSDAARWCGGVRPFSTLGHPTQLGVWMALMSVLAIDDAVTRKSWPMGITSLVAAVTCVVTLSRAGWLALLVGMAWWFWPRISLSHRDGVEPYQRNAGPRAGAKRTRDEAERPVKRVGVRASHLVTALVGALILIVAVAGSSALMERLTNFFVAPTRVQMWTTAFGGFREHPWLGWGFDAFALVDQTFRSPEAWRYEWGGTAGHAHSVIPQTLATEGILGALALLAAAIVVLREWRRSPPETGPQSVVIALAAASMVTFSGTAVAAVGVLALAQTLRGERVAITKWIRLPLVALTALTLMMMGASIAARLRPGETTAARLEPWNAQWPALQGEMLERAGRLPEAGIAYARAVELAPLGVFHANVGRVASKQGAFPHARSAFDRARRVAPLDARIALDAAEANMRAEELALADATLRSLLFLYPSDGPAWLALARLRLRESRTMEARAALEASLDADWRDWPEGLGLARAILSELLQRAGDPELAAKLAQGPRIFALPGDACGAPSLLRR